MSQRIVHCHKCRSTKIKDINPEVKDSQTITVKVKARCLECGEEFEYTSRTNTGPHNLHIMY